MNGLEYILNSSEEKKQWVNVTSNLESLDGNFKEIKIQLMADGKPKAMAFFDIDGTLAHLGPIHGKAIAKIFPEQDPKELEETYYKGFKLGNSFREFDRMRGIYVDGHENWKDPEVYFKERLLPHQKEIDEPGYSAHEVASEILKMYGKFASTVADEVFKENNNSLEKENIAPIILLAKMYSKLGIPIVGFTANSKELVYKLAKYLKLSDSFIDIATDEDMAGGGKEIAIEYLLKKVSDKGLNIPKNRLIFVGDSLRGDIGSSLKAHVKDPEIIGQGVLVLEDKDALVKIKKDISENPDLKQIAESIDVQGLVISEVPVDENGNPILLSRFRKQFLEKL